MIVRRRTIRILDVMLGRLLATEYTRSSTQATLFLCELWQRALMNFPQIPFARLFDTRTFLLAPINAKPSKFVHKHKIACAAPNGTHLNLVARITLLTFTKHSFKLKLCRTEFIHPK